MVIQKPIVDQRRIIYSAYMAQLEDSDKYTIFKSRDIASILDVPIANVAALIRKCMLAELISKVGREKQASLYTLTSEGNKRGLYYMRNYNPIIGKLRTDKEE